MKKVLLRALELAFEKVDILTQTIDDADARHLVNLNFQEILERDIDQKEANIEKLKERVSLLQLECTEKRSRIEELESLEVFQSKDKLTYEETSAIGDRFMDIVGKEETNYPEDDEAPEYPTLFTLDNIVYFENSNGVFMELQDGEHVGVPVQITYEEYTVAVNRYINK